MSTNEMENRLQMFSFYHHYAINFKTSYFPVLTENRRQKKTTEREILLLGDSHSWGQGSPDYDGTVFYSSHMPFIYNKGYYARLSEYVHQKLVFYPHALIPFMSTNIQQVQGMFRETKLDIIAPVAADGFYAPFPAQDKTAILGNNVGEDNILNMHKNSSQNSTAANLGYLAEVFKFNSSVCVMAPEKHGCITKEAECTIHMAAHARKLFIGVLAGPHGAKLEVELHTSTYYVKPSGYPKVFHLIAGEQVEINVTEVKNDDSGKVWIDTFAADGVMEKVYCIDYGMKQQGILTFRSVQPNEQAIQLHMNGISLETPALLIRGVVFDANHIRNFSMGGHTTGQWLGDGTNSFNDGPHPHVDELLTYVPFTPTLAVIQAPVVNEYLRQTPIPQFQSNLMTIIEKLNRHLNKNETHKMDVLMFTTPGDQNILFKGAPSSTITYDDYYKAVHQVCRENGYGLIDFRQFFVDLVEAGMLDHDLLYDDAIHPSPFLNEFIATALKNAFDLIW